MENAETGEGMNNQETASAETRKRVSSQYEMNLAEFPLSVLSTRKPNDLQAIEYKDSITGKNGEVVERAWKVAPSSTYGFGSPRLLSTIFEMFQIWKDDGFKSRQIPIGSLYNLVKRQGLQVEGIENFNRVRDDLNALVDMSIEAKNAYWDREKQAYVDVRFHIIDSVHFYHRNPKNPQQEVLPFSYATASDVIWKSVESNSFITLKGVDGDLFHSFSPGEQRFALYLAKMLRKDSEHWRDVELICSQIPINASTYKDKKKILTRYCDGLIKKGFPYLASYSFERKKRGQGHTAYFYRPGVERRAEPTKKKNAQSSAEALELVRHFYKLFHGAENALPTSKETSQATSLITQHGLEKARYVVDFSHRVAPETNYQPQTFNGIVSYTARALADYDQAIERDTRHQAIAACTQCDSNGWIEKEDENGGYSRLARCTHQPLQPTEHVT